MFFTRLKKLLFALICTRYFRAAWLFRVFPSIEHQFLFHEEFDTVVDVGANKGQFSLIVREKNPASTIYAFEPQKKAATIFDRIFAGDDRVTLFRVAIGSETRTSIMNISHKDDSSSILGISNLQTEYYPSTYREGYEEIVETTLDSCISTEVIVGTSLLKIDVQGYELEVLKGSKTHLDKFNFIYCECSYLPLYEGQPLATEIIDFLRTHGYVVAGVYNTSFSASGIAIQSDILFCREL